MILIESPSTSGRAFLCWNGRFGLFTPLGVVIVHYRNGREAKNGDTVVQLGHEGKIVGVGVLHDATPGNDYCNGSIAPIATAVSGACMCDCLHMDDVKAMLKENGLDKRPEGK